MSGETTGADGTQAAPDAQPQAGASQAQVADAQSSQADGADNASSTVDVAALQRELTETRREAAKNRTELKRLQDAAKTAADASLPEQERLQRRLAELEQANAEHERERSAMVTEAAITKSAIRLGFHDPDDAVAHLMRDRTAIEYDDQGAPKNVDRLLADLLKAKSHLGGAGRPAGSADGGVNGAQPASKDMNALIRQAAGRGT